MGHLPALSATSSHQPPLVLCQSGTPMLQLSPTVSNFEFWGPSLHTKFCHLPRFTIPVSDFLPRSPSLPTDLCFPQSSQRVPSLAPWMATARLEVKYTFMEGVRTLQSQCHMLHCAPPWAGRSASALTNIFPMLLPVISFSLHCCCSLSIAWAARAPGVAGAVVPWWVSREGSGAAGVFSCLGHDAP